MKVGTLCFSVIVPKLRVS